MTIEMTAKGNIPRKLDIPEGARLRVVTHHKVSLDKIRRVMDIVKTRFKPESLSFVNKAGLKRDSVNVDDLGNTENLRDQAVQERLIREYLKEYEPDAKTLEKVFQLNSKYDSYVNGDEAGLRNVEWSLKSMEWDNLFNYGEGNAINFDKLNGVVGIFGKNYSGKSSVVDSMLYTVYNSISKNNRKNLNIINQNKPSGCGRVEIDVSGKTYIIERKSEKYTRKLHGEETEEAKTDVEFTVIDPATDEETSLNSLDRNGTDKAIRKIFGSIDDFLLTSMSSQMGAMTFINEGSTKRKEILAKFLDLDQFEKKFKLSKNDSIETRALLKKLEDNTFDEDITQLLGQLTDNEKARETQERKCTKLTTQLETISERVREIDGLFASAPVELINIGKETARLAAAGQERSDYSLKAAQTKNQKKDVLEQAKVLKGLLDKTDVSALKEKITECEGIQKELTSLEAEINLRETQKENYEKKVSILGEVPCGPEFSHCKFIKDAYESKSLLDACRKSLMALRRRHNQLTTKLEGMDVETLEQERKLYNDRDKEYADLCTEATNLRPIFGEDKK